MKLVVLGILACITTAYGLKCYVCAGSNEDACALDKMERDHEQTCSSGLDKCMRVWAKKDDQTAVARSCSNELACEAAKKTCDETKEGECAVDCCDSDFCNSNNKQTYGLKCYQCAASEDACAKSKLEGDKAQYEKTCGSGFDKCMSVWAKKDNQTALVRSCSNEALCEEANKVCDNLTEGECVVDCCEGDSCNSNNIQTSGLKCYVCSGTGRGDACAKSKLERDQAKYGQTCGSGFDKCMRVRAKKDDQTVVAHSCSNELGCAAAEKLCDNDKDVECAVDCCDENYCNAATSVSFSFMGMIVYSLIGLVFLK